ncbi:E3 SUMO-protein ligase KIAA1586-like [Haematobia irritans]|uniref:E3 SUMO-protein ligase KIAA1586-like n=1 Tax=Haematobia irritans TaxID=7368 RepID=UPI003F50081D
MSDIKRATNDAYVTTISVSVGYMSIYTNKSLYKWNEFKGTISSETMKSKEDRGAVEKPKRTPKEEWVRDPDYKSWLILEDGTFSCTLCGKKLKVSSGKNDLQKHKMSKKHSDAEAATISNQPSIRSVFSGEDNETKKIEIMLSFFLVEHNISFKTMDHLSKVLKASVTDSHSVNNISIGRTKATAIVKNVIGEQQQQSLSKLLNSNYFSLCIDGATDITKKKVLYLVVRVCINFEILDLFFGLLDVENGDAESLFNAVKDYFAEKKVDYKKRIIGFGADGEATMTGKRNSVASRFKKEIPHLFVIKCVCHSLALCSSKAALRLPSSVETLTRQIYNYIAESPKRINTFAEIQTLLEFKPRKILHPAQTRWLSLEMVVNRILDLYEPLKIYFAFTANVDHSKRSPKKFK